MSKKSALATVRIGTIVFVVLLAIGVSFYAVAPLPVARVEAGPDSVGRPAAAATVIRRSTPRPTARNIRATPTRTPITRGLLPGPTLLKPDANVFLDPWVAVLEWSRVKTALGKNEYYIITIKFKHDDKAVWTDYAYTQKTTWPVLEHAYLIDIAYDPTFTWSVQLIRATGKDKNGVPTGVPVSLPSKERVFHINRRGSPDSNGGGPPSPPPTPDCGAYCPWLAEKPTHNQLAGILATLGLGLTLGMVVFVKKPVSRSGHD
jgi:hypothetical protein